jgi:hypothetical protein
MLQNYKCAFKGNKSKVVHRTVLTYMVPTSKKVWDMLFQTVTALLNITLIKVLVKITVLCNFMQQWNVFSITLMWNILSLLWVWRAGASITTNPSGKKFPWSTPFTHSVKNSPTFLKLLNCLMISNMKFPDNVMKTNTSVVILSVLFTLLHNMFMNINSAEINFHLMKIKWEVFVKCATPVRCVVCLYCHTSPVGMNRKCFNKSFLC